jgi:hypothetical protein
LAAKSTEIKPLAGADSYYGYRNVRKDKLELLEDDRRRTG